MRTHAQVLEDMCPCGCVSKDEAAAITACLDALRKARRTICDMGAMPCRKESCDCVLAVLDAVLGRDDGR